MTSATLQAALSALRSMLIAAGGYLVARGLLSEESLREITGALLVIVPLVWGIIQKYQADRQAKAREVVAVHVGMVKADATVGPTPPVAPMRVPDLIDMLSPNVVVTTPNNPPLVTPLGTRDYDKKAMEDML